MLSRPEERAATVASRLGPFEGPAGATGTRTVESLRAAVKECSGATLLSGFARVTASSGARRYQSALIGSISQVVEAWILDQTGSHSLQWETDVVPDDGRGAIFILPMTFGNGSPYPQPTGAYDLLVNGRRVLTITNVLRSRRWTGLGVSFSFLAERTTRAPSGMAFALDEHIRDESHLADGWGVLEVPSALLASAQPLVLGLRVVNPQRSTNWIRIGRSGKPFRTEDVVPALLHHWDSTASSHLGGGMVLVGDIHNHSGETSLFGDRACGVGTKESLFEYARDVAGLDFFSLSEHDWQMTDAEWKGLAELNEQFNTAEFITIPGFEWTSARYGHRNVYFREPASSFFPSLPLSDSVNFPGFSHPTPKDLWAWIENAGVDAITVPHHMSAAQFPLSLDNFHHGSYDRVAEIYSCWGDSLQQDSRLLLGAHHIPELAFINSIQAGYRVGFVASSDSHDGHPGNAQGTSNRNHLFHFLGSGVTGVIVESRTREAIFDALRDRRCFAATAPGLSVATSLEGNPMGCEIDAATLPSRPVLTVEFDSEQPLERVEIYRDGEQVDTCMTGDMRTSIEWVDERFEAGPASWFVRVIRDDGETAWSSPIWSVGEGT